MSKKSDRQYPLAKSYTDRHGRLRWRVRRKGVSIELGANYGTEDFVRRYADAVARLNAPREAGKARVKPGTMRARCRTLHVTGIPRMHGRNSAQRQADT